MSTHRHSLRSWASPCMFVYMLPCVCYMACVFQIAKAQGPGSLSTGLDPNYAVTSSLSAWYSSNPGGCDDDEEMKEKSAVDSFFGSIVGLSKYSCEKCRAGFWRFDRYHKQYDTVKS